MKKPRRHGLPSTKEQRRWQELLSSAYLPSPSRDGRRKERRRRPSARGGIAAEPLRRPAPLIAKQLQRIDEKLLSEQAPHVEPGATHHDSGTAYAAGKQARDRAGTGDLPRGCPQSLAREHHHPIGATVSAQDVLTWHNDVARTGQNLHESVLTPANVHAKTLGKLFVIAVDGKVDPEPLYVKALQMPNRGTRNVLFVATEHDSVYAFDADSGQEFWHVRLLRADETTSDDRNCDQITPEIGVTATPVIDRQQGSHGVLYAVAMSKDSQGQYRHRLHALDLQTGAEQLGGPVEIAAKYPDGPAFDAKQYAERAALLFVNRTLYFTWTSHCDIRPYNGWIMAYDARTLQQRSVLNLTPSGREGAIWQSGAGPAADAQGNVYMMSANGDFDTSLDARGFPDGGDFGNSFLKIRGVNGRLQVADYFTMFNVEAESKGDDDLGSGGPLVLPDMLDARGAVRHLVVGAGKDLNIYLLDREAMGKFNAKRNNVYQEIPKAFQHEYARPIPTYFNGCLYYATTEDPLRQYRFRNARLLPEPASHTSITFVYPGASPSISANGTREGIVWVLENEDPAVLHAYDANDVSRELYNSDQAPLGRDHFGAGNKFITPTVANGKVYVGTTDGVGVFGLLSK